MLQIKENKIDEQKPIKKKFPTLCITPIGGLGEIGRNMTLFEYKNDALIIDCGILFPDRDHMGIDLILPDFKSLKSKKNQIHSLLITHGHEDHIGGIPFLLQEFPNLSIFAPEMAMELIKKKLDNYHIKYPAQKLHTISKNTSIPISHSFSAEFIEVTHSIKDSYAIALKTPVGKVLHTGDFKIELESAHDGTFDFQRFAQLGQEGVHVLLSDSTNIENKTEKISENNVLSTIESIIKNAEGRTIISTFASHINRVLKIIEMAKKQDKRVVILGRSMEYNFEIAKKLAYIQSKDNCVIKSQSMKHYPDNKLVIITTGTQGETLSVLTRLSQDSVPGIKLKTADNIIVSASVIPGNEKPFYKVLNKIYEKGCNIFYSKNSDVHVSGHGSADNLLLMLKLIQPKFFIPVHGEKRHQILHAKLAQQIGIPSKHTVIMDNGDIASISKHKIQITDKIALKQLFVQNKEMGHFADLVSERNKLVDYGLLFIILSIHTDNIQEKWTVNLVSQGFLQKKELSDLERNIKKTIANMMLKIDIDKFDSALLEKKITQSIEIILRKINKTPILKIKVVEYNI